MIIKKWRQLKQLWSHFWVASKNRIPIEIRFKNKEKQQFVFHAKLKVSIEAGATNSWHKYVGENGLIFGIDEFGKSEPYKKIFDYFGLTSKKISKKIIDDFEKEIYNFIQVCPKEMIDKLENPINDKTKIKEVS